MAAMRAGVVGEDEGTDDELTRLYRLDVVADLDDHATIFMAHRHGLIDIVESPVGPEIRAAYAGSRQADDSVAWPEDFRLVALFDADIAGA